MFLLAALALTSSTSTTAPIAEVYVRDTRLAAPFDPDTELRLSGKRISELGATTLAEALEHVPAVYVRPAGRGGVQADIRGGRRGSVMILVDGVPISDPFFGNFDLGSIPTTDIAQVRVSKSPASPLDGPGGSGGVIEVITRAAVGTPRLDARVLAGDAPGAEASATARAQVVPGISARVSGGGTFASRDFIAGADRFDQDEQGAQAALLVEHVSAGWRLGADGWVSRRSFFTPPSNVEGADLLEVDPDLSLRASVLGEVRDDRWRGSLRLFAQQLERDSLRYRNADLAAAPLLDRIAARRIGAIAQVQGRLLDPLNVRATATFLDEDGENTLSSGASAEGSVDMLQAAAGADWRPFEWLRVQAAAGAALPLSGGADPWPEAKIELTWSATIAQLRLTAARKGVLPTLRDRFQLNTGNPALAPEMVSFGEAEIVLRPVTLAALTVSGYWREVADLIRFCGSPRIENCGDVAIRGVDLRIDLAPDEAIYGGASWEVSDAFSDTLGDPPLDFLPDHRVDLWAGARHGKTAGGWARFKYVGERADQMMTLHAYATFDAGAWYAIDGTRVSVRAENLFDQSYDARANVPGFGRTLWLGLDVSL